MTTNISSLLHNIGMPIIECYRSFVYLLDAPGNTLSTHQFMWNAWVNWMCGMRCYTNLDASVFSIWQDEWTSRLNPFTSQEIACSKEMCPEVYENLLPLWHLNEQNQQVALNGMGYLSNCNQQLNYVKGARHYELSNHLGNVLSVVSDRKIEVDESYTYQTSGGYIYQNGSYIADASGDYIQNIAADGLINGYVAEVISATDYYAFGAPMPGRSFNNSDYCYGYGNHEKMDVISGGGNNIDMGDRWLDTRLGRTPKPDAKGVIYPGVSPYSYALNTPMQAIDPDGKVVIFVNGNHYGDGGSSAYWRQYETRTRTVYYQSGGQYDFSYGYMSNYSHEEKYTVETYAFDKQVMQQFGDNNARYYDGALGGWAPFNVNNHTQSYERYMSGYMQAKTDAGDIIANLKRDADGNITETIKIVSHSMGGVYSKGFVQGLQAYIEANKIQGVKIEIEVDFAPYDSNDPLNSVKSGVPTYQASHSDDSVAGNKPGKGSKQVATDSDAGQGHSIFDFKSTVKKLGNMLKDVRGEKK